MIFYNALCFSRHYNKPSKMSLFYSFSYFYYRYLLLRHNSSSTKLTWLYFPSINHRPDIIRTHFKVEISYRLPINFGTSISLFQTPIQRHIRDLNPKLLYIIGLCSTSWAMVMCSSVTCSQYEAILKQKRKEM